MRHSKRLVLFFVVTFAISGFIEGYFYSLDEGAAAFTHALVIAVICFAWCKAESKERNVPPPMGSPILCGLLPAIGIPVHLFRTRPFVDAAVATGKAVVVLVAAIAVFGVALYIGSYARI